MENAAVVVQDADGNEYGLSECECDRDNTHKQNCTVCRYCYEKRKAKMREIVSDDGICALLLFDV